LLLDQALPNKRPLPPYSVTFYLNGLLLLREMTLTKDHIQRKPLHLPLYMTEKMNLKNNFPGPSRLVDRSGRNSVHCLCLGIYLRRCGVEARSIRLLCDNGHYRSFPDFNNFLHYGIQVTKYPPISFKITQIQGRSKQKFCYDDF